MNSKLAITAIVMFAVVMGMSSIAPAIAVPPDHANNEASKAGKKLVCHYEAEEVIENEDGTTTTIPEHWEDINISGNAVKKHLANHAQVVDSETGETEPDFVISDEDAETQAANQQKCDDLKIAFPAPEDETEG